MQISCWGNLLLIPGVADDKKSPFPAPSLPPGPLRLSRPATRLTPPLRHLAGITRNKRPDWTRAVSALGKILNFPGWACIFVPFVIKIWNSLTKAPQVVLSCQPGGENGYSTDSLPSAPTPQTIYTVKLTQLAVLNTVMGWSPQSRSCQSAPSLPRLYSNQNLCRSDAELSVPTSPPPPSGGAALGNTPL